MPVKTQTTKEAQKQSFAAGEYTMFSREDWDQKQIRYDFVQPRDIDISTEIIEREDQTVVDPRTLETPVGPTGAIDDLGNQGGMEEVVVEGEEFETYVYNHGFTVHPDLDGEDQVGRQRNYVGEMFQYFADLNFMLGMDGPANSPGFWGWLRSAVPSDRVFDCEDFDGDTGDEDYTDVPEDLLRGEAIKAVGSPTVLDINAGWELAVGAPDAITQLQGYSAGETTDVESGPTYWERLEDAETVQGAYRLPYDMQPDYLPDNAVSELPDVMSFPVVDESTAVNPSGVEPIGNDEIFLLPDMGTVSEDYFGMWEMGDPEEYGPVDTRGGEEAYDFKYRWGSSPDPTGNHATADDVVIIQNVSELFGR